MNDKIAKEMIEKMTVTNTKPTYASLKNKEEELLAQLREVQEEIANAENDIIKEKLNTALQCLADVDKMTNGYYRCSVETYCEGCEEDIDIDIDLAEIIEALQQIRKGERQMNKKWIITFENGYCDCNIEEEFEGTYEEAVDFAEEYLDSYAETSAYVHFGWDEEYTEEEFKDYCENCSFDIEESEGKDDD